MDEMTPEQKLTLLLAFAFTVGGEFMRRYQETKKEEATEAAAFIASGGAVLDVNIRALFTPAPVVELVMRTAKGEACLHAEPVKALDFTLGATSH
jgi:hypothetical protein